MGGQSLLGQFMRKGVLLEQLDHKKFGTFLEIPHTMKRAIACFLLATACLLAKLHHLRVANILYLYDNITRNDRRSQEKHSVL